MGLYSIDINTRQDSRGNGCVKASYLFTTIYWTKHRYLPGLTYYAYFNYDRQPGIVYDVTEALYNTYRDTKYPDIRIGEKKLLDILLDTGKLQQNPQLREKAFKYAMNLSLMED